MVWGIHWQRHFAAKAVLGASDQNDKVTKAVSYLKSKDVGYDSYDMAYRSARLMLKAEKLCRKHRLKDWTEEDSRAVRQAAKTLTQSWILNVPAQGDLVPDVPMKTCDVGTLTVFDDDGDDLDTEAAFSELQRLNDAMYPKTQPIERDIFCDAFKNNNVMLAGKLIGEAVQRGLSHDDRCFIDGVVRHDLRACMGTKNDPALPMVFNARLLALVDGVLVTLDPTYVASRGDKVITKLERCSLWNPQQFSPVFVMMAQWQRLEPADTLDGAYVFDDAGLSRALEQGTVGHWIGHALQAGVRQSDIKKIGEAVARYVQGSHAVSPLERCTFVLDGLLQALQCDDVKRSAMTLEVCEAQLASLVQWGGVRLAQTVLQWIQCVLGQHEYIRLLMAINNAYDVSRVGVKSLL